MYKKVLYNIKKIKKMWGEGERQYLNPKHSLCENSNKIYYYFFFWGGGAGGGAGVSGCGGSGMM